VTPGDVVVIVGAGPIGLAAVAAARLFTPSQVIVVDPAASRRERGLAFGADVALSPDDPVQSTILELTNGRGADVAIEAVGIPSSFELCTEVVRAGGRIANVGVHGAPATLHLERLWIRDVTITTGLVDTRTTPLLLRLLAEGHLPVSAMCTHRFALDEMETAYDVFSRAGETDALKVALFRRG
jgi:alcohol dehydrogenase